jgi:hypothetical protein
MLPMPKGGNGFLACGLWNRAGPPRHTSKNGPSSPPALGPFLWYGRDNSPLWRDRGWRGQLRRRDRGYRAGTSPDWVKVKDPDRPAMIRVKDAFETRTRKRADGPAKFLAGTPTACCGYHGSSCSRRKRWPMSLLNPRPKGHHEHSAIEDYVVEDQADHVLHTSKTKPRPSLGLARKAICQSAFKFDPGLEWAPRGGQDQATGLTICRVCCFSNWTGLI